MAEEDEYVAGTIATIGSLITKPKMTEKYLKKPPFRRGALWVFWDGFAPGKYQHQNDK